MLPLFCASIPAEPHFYPGRTIPIAFLNVPGCVHGTFYSGIYTKFGGEFEKHCGKYTVDLAFSGVQRPSLINLLQDDLFSDLATEEERNAEVHLKRQATPMRQAAELGMRILQGSFPRLKDCFIYGDREERLIALKCSILLFNLRIRLVGINQMRNV